MAVVAIAVGAALVWRTGRPLPYAGILPLLAIGVAVVAWATTRLEFIGSYVLPLLALWLLWLALPRLAGQRWSDDRLVSGLMIGLPLGLVVAYAAYDQATGRQLWSTDLWGWVMVGAMCVGAGAAGIARRLRRPTSTD